MRLWPHHKPGKSPDMMDLDELAHAAAGAWAKRSDVEFVKYAEAYRERLTTEDYFAHQFGARWEGVKNHPPYEFTDPNPTVAPSDFGVYLKEESE